MEQVSLDKVNENVEMLKQAMGVLQMKLDFLIDSEDSIEIESVNENDFNEEDLKLLEEYRKDKKEGNLVSHEDLKTELGL